MFNNAGIMHAADADATTTPENIWDLTMNINVKGTFLLPQIPLPLILLSPFPFDPYSLPPPPHPPPPNPSFLP